MADAPSRPFRRIILKISGESFAKPGEFGIDPEELSLIAGEIVDAVRSGKGSRDQGIKGSRETSDPEALDPSMPRSLDPSPPQVAVVVGGGNIIRGGVLAETGTIHQSNADYMGMLGTVINGVALREAIENLGQPARLMSAIDIPAVAEPFIRARALRHFEKGRVLILAAGTGNPFFTTDTCAALRGAELGADVVLKATKVDGVYTSDPKKNADATRYEKLTFAEAIEKQLGVMDLTALTMCMEHNLPVVVFDFKVKGNIRRVVTGERVGTLVTN